MRIAYLHFHLKTGGVTTVIRQQIDAVKDNCRTLAISGAVPESTFPAPVVQVPGLAYDVEQAAPPDPKQVAKEILDALVRKWPDGCDLLHVHNPTLAKNRHLLKVLRLLAEAGIRLLCQVHDFAEDGRPQAYSDDPYPADCHWVTINDRDRRILLDAGLKPEGVHLLPNTVRPLPAAPGEPEKRRHVLYPIRAIRRKNIGEAVLLSLFFPPATPLLITQPANSPQDKKSAADWQRFVGAHNLNVRFDAGVGADFPELVAQSRFLLTTSITEGFGFSFLEPWTAGKLLWGRKLPDICTDFEENGLKLDHLYHRISIPLRWLSGTGFVERWGECFAAACRRFSHPADRETVKDAWASVSAEGTVDFGLLDETAQRTVIRSMCEEAEKKEELVRRHPFLQPPARVDDAPGLIARNRRIVLDRYRPETYRKKLLNIYRNAIGTKVAHTPDKAIIRSAFLAPDRFSLLKWSAYDS